MSEVNLEFVSWVRRGLRAHAPTNAVSQPTVAIKLSGRVDDASAWSATYLAATIGPADATRTDVAPLSDARVYPQPNAVDVEADYFAHLEVDDLTFPWSLSPGIANGAVLPWVTLIVLAANEFTTFQTSGPFPGIAVTSGASLPEFGDSWAFAHVECARGPNDPTGFTPEQLATPTPAYRARLIAPRPLQVNTSYLALVVPTFEVGRRAGLGIPPNGAAANQPIARADGLTLPVYRRWSFRTGTATGFREQLEKLEARSASQLRLGLRSFSAAQAQPEAGLELSAAYTVGSVLRGARVFGTVYDDVDAAKLATYLDLPFVHAAEGPPIQGDIPIWAKCVAPPLYGRWYAGRSWLGPGIPASMHLPPPLQDPWFEMLNTCPPFRAFAALGTAVVQRNQERWMAEAWDQFAGIDATNKALARRETSRAISARMVERRLVGQPWARTLQVAGRLLAQTKLDSQGAQGALVKSGDLTASISPRLLRPGSALGKRITRAGGPITEFLDAKAASVGQDLATALVAQLHPRDQSLGTVDGDGILSPDKNRVSANPVFDEPLLPQLMAVSPDWVLANIEAIPPESMVALEVATEFLVSFLIGVNHEMNRELVFRGFPTDMRGICFRRFWPRADGDSDINNPSDDDLGLLATHLGETVLLFRTDLFKRYPNAIVCALKPVNGKPPADLTDAILPAFTGKLTADIQYWAFPFSVDEATSGGYYACVAEPPIGNRFGVAHAAQTVPLTPAQIDASETTASGLATKMVRRPLRELRTFKDLVQ